MPYGFNSFDDRVLEFYEPLKDKAPHLLRAASRLEDLAADGAALEGALAPVRPLLGDADPLVDICATVLLNAYEEDGAAPPGRDLMAKFDALGGMTCTLSLPLRHPRIEDLYLMFLWIAKPLDETLDAGPAYLDRFSESMVDTLIDEGCVPAAWLPRLGESARADYLRARADIASLSEDQLVANGAWDELARRIALGTAAPRELPEAAAARLALVRAAKTDDEALLRLAAEAGLDTDTLRSWLSGETVPGWGEVKDQSVMNALLERSELNVPGLDAGPLDAEQQIFAAYLGIRNAKAALYAWDWKRALAEAGSVMGFTGDEWLRQEAASLCAAAQLQSGRPDRAHATLDRVWSDPMTVGAAINHGIAARAAGFSARASDAMCLASESLTADQAGTQRLKTACVLEAVRAERVGGTGPSERLARNIAKLEEVLSGNLPSEIRAFSDGLPHKGTVREPDLRSAYMLFGVDYEVVSGLDMEDVYRAYPAIRRRIRGEDDPVFSLEDLDWALGFLEHQRHTIDKETQAFRIPTNGNAYGYGTAEKVSGILSDDPRPIPRRTSVDHVAYKDLQGRVWASVHALHLTKLAS